MEEFKSALRETLRTTIIAVIAIAIAQIDNGSINVQQLALAGLVGLLRGLEKYLHEMGQTTGLSFKMIK